MVSLANHTKDDRSFYVRSFIFSTPEHDVQWAGLSECGAESIQRPLGDKTTYMNQLTEGDHEPNPKALHTHLRVFALPDLWRSHPRR